MAVVELDAKAVIRWWFRSPMRRMKPLREHDAAAVARRLLIIAFLTDHGGLERLPAGSHAIKLLAADILTLGLLRGIRPPSVASGDECMRFLNEYSPLLAVHDLSDALALNAKVADDINIRLSPTRLEYRADDPEPLSPSISYRAKRKKPPPDDISERICDGLEMLQAAQCSRSVACITELVRESGLLRQSYPDVKSITTQHISSRIKKVRRTPGYIPLLKREYAPPLFGYWENLDPANMQKSATDPDWPEFFFAKCNC